jgi:hypothetical protein
MEPIKQELLPVDDSTPEDVLRLFRAFVIQNATVWQAGSNHHHPIWELVANCIDGPEPTNGPEYAFIQPLNRERLSVLIRNGKEMKAPDDKCAACGLERREHSYNGACYGLCGDFIEPLRWCSCKASERDGQHMAWCHFQADQ